HLLDNVYSVCGKFSNNVDLIPTPSSPSILGLWGLVVDEIEAVGRPWRQEWGVEGYHRYILQYFAIIKDMKRRSLGKNMDQKLSDDDDDDDDGSDIIYTNNPSRRNQAFWCLPIGGCYVNGPPKRGKARADDVVPVFKEFIDHCNFCFEKDEELEQRRQQQQSENDTNKNKDNDNKPSPPPPPGGLDQETIDFMSDRWEDLRAKGSYLHNMMHMDRKRPFLTAQKGYLGMAPGHAQPGDVVVLLCGDSIPYVLRPVGDAVGAGAGDGDGKRNGGGDRDGNSDGNLYFTFVGEAYCDGIMDGELEGRLEREGERQDIFLV
ncbi:hypothetical protein QBC32DRAFT_213723, partial [Pseudoneurospora amorphoporcata]